MSTALQSLDRSPGDTAGQRPGRRRTTTVALALLFMPLLGSLAVWLAVSPNRALTGYEARSKVSAPGLLLVGGWWGLAALALVAGTKAGTSRGSVDSIARTSLQRTHRVACVLAIVGTAAAYAAATHGHVSTFFSAIGEQQANKLRNNLEYGAGLSTLRYASVIAGGISLKRLLARARPKPIDLASIVSLLLVALLASRLVLLMACFVAIGLLLAEDGLKPRRRLLRLLGTLAVVGILALTWMNWARNANYYRTYGVTNPFAMAAWNAASYVASPAQAQIGYADAIMTKGAPLSTGISDALEVTIIPSYLNSTPPNQRNYRKYVDLVTFLTTNSSLVGLLSAGGLATMVTAPLGLAIAGYFFARLGLSGPVGIAFAAVLGYAFAEYWRIYLLNQGIVHFVLLCAPLAALRIPRSRLAEAAGA